MKRNSHLIHLSLTHMGQLFFPSSLTLLISQLFWPWRPAAVPRDVPRGQEFGSSEQCTTTKRILYTWTACTQQGPVRERERERDRKERKKERGRGRVRDRNERERGRERGGGRENWHFNLLARLQIANTSADCWCSDRRVQRAKKNVTWPRGRKTVKVLPETGNTAWFQRKSCPGLTLTVWITKKRKKSAALPRRQDHNEGWQSDVQRSESLRWTQMSLYLSWNLHVNLSLSV